MRDRQQAHEEVAGRGELMSTDLGRGQGAGNGADLKAVSGGDAMGLDDGERGECVRSDSNGRGPGRVNGAPFPGGRGAPSEQTAPAGTVGPGACGGGLEAAGCLPGVGPQGGRKDSMGSSSCRHLRT